MNFIIGTGYHYRSEWDSEFAKIWYRNLREHTPFPKRIAVITTGAHFPVIADEINVYRGENLGHGGDANRTTLDGWTAGIPALCMLAYNTKADLIFREQDCLCFGPWVEKAYADMGEADMIFGPQMTTEPWMPCAQALFIIRNRFLLTFVKRYLALGDDITLLPEHRFVMLADQEPERFKRLSFGADRERPIPFEDPVWYVQQLKGEELDEIKRRGLL